VRLRFTVRTGFRGEDLPPAEKNNKAEAEALVVLIAT